MTKKPEALRLAELLETAWQPTAIKAAAELRRLHEESDLLASAADKLRALYREERTELLRQRDQATAQRDALLEALRKIGAYTGEGPTYTTPWQKIVADLGQTARAALAPVEK
jgi:hypothetical protein